MVYLVVNELDRIMPKQRTTDEGFLRDGTDSETCRVHPLTDYYTLADEGRNS